MKIADLLNSALRSIGRNKTRSLLTMLGIIIGVGAVIGMMAIGKGSEESIRKELQSLGTNIIFINAEESSRHGVSQGSGMTGVLRAKDAEEIKKYCSSVNRITPIVSHSALIVYGTNNSRSTIFGAEADYFHIQNLEVRYGIPYDEVAGKSLQKVCVIGTTVAENLFDHPKDAVGKIIRLDKIPFRVIGVLKEKGQSFGMDRDNLIVAPFKTVQKRLQGIDYASAIYASTESETLVDQAVLEIEDVMLNRLKKVSAGEPTFNIRTQKEMMDVMGNITGMITMLLAVIASISLFVGGIGIMNIMLVSVTERTREIGLRLAVGAPKQAILFQFLVEAILLCLIGGVLGILLGYGIATLAGNALGWAIQITPWSVTLAFGFSSFIGVVFGFFPARKASRLNPIQALRFE